MRIAIVEDDPAQLELLRSWLLEASYDCLGFESGQTFRDALRRETFDLLVVDWNLPDTSGPELLSWVRSNIDWHIPVLFITSRDREEDIVHALNSGADDYMIKPIKRAETLARITALLRRALPDAAGEEHASYPPFDFDLGSQRVTVEDQIVNLTNKEFQLALLMFRNAGRLLSRSYIMENVWGVRADLSTRTVDTHVSRIRNKMGIRPDRGWRLSAIYHHGYRLEAVNQQ